MKTRKLNLFIVDDNRTLVSALKHFLNTRFENSINITTFYDGETCLEKINENTDIVILDYFLKGENGLDILKGIKEINSTTEVIMLSSNEDVALAIETFKAGAKDYVVKGSSSWRKIAGLVQNMVTAPIKMIVEEFGVSKYMAIFLLTFLTMGAIVFFTLQSISS